MKPIHFKQSNHVLSGGEPTSEQIVEVSELPVYFNGQQYISCWKLGFSERLLLFLTGKIWVQLFTQEHAPIVLQATTPFLPIKK